MDWLWIAFDYLILLAGSTAIFDCIHWALHQWVHSRFRPLRMFAGWHQVHHRFLDRGLKVHGELGNANFWAHIVPEYITSFVGTLAIGWWLNHWAMVGVLLTHTWWFAKHALWDEGMDKNHMALDRVSGNRPTWWVNKHYHAMHHVEQSGHFASLVNIFDAIFGTALVLRDKRVLIIGGRGALGSAFDDELDMQGAIILDEGCLWLDVDILILASGSRDPLRGEDANFVVPVSLTTSLLDAGKDRLIPPEVWGVGSEAEIVGSDVYARQKRAFADYAATFWRNNAHLTYRHIVPSAFTSKLNGPAIMSAETVAKVSLFFIRRGWRYIPVTYTGLALLNFFRFTRQSYRMVQ